MYLEREDLVHGDRLEADRYGYFELVTDKTEKDLREIRRTEVFLML